MNEEHQDDEYITKELANAMKGDVSKWSLTELVKAYGVIMEERGESAMVGEPVWDVDQERIDEIEARVAALEAELAALKQDAVVGRMLRRLLFNYGKAGIEMHLYYESENTNKPQVYFILEVDDEPMAEAEGVDLDDALAAAGLTPKEEVKE